MLVIFFFGLLILGINIIRIFQTKGSLLKAAVLIIFFAVLFTQSSIFWTRDIAYNVAIIKPLEYGWPISFHFVDHPMKEIWQAPVTFWNNFFGSVVINAILCGAGLFSLAHFFRKAGIVVRPLTFKVTLITIVTLIVVIISASFIYLKIFEWRNPGINSTVVPLGGGNHLLPVPAIR